MSISKKLLAARSHFAFIVGLSIAAFLAVSLDSSLGYDQIAKGVRQIIAKSTNQTPIVVPSKLSASDIKNAQIAWGYFEKNTAPETGLVNSVDGFHSTTVWDQSSYLLGLISAYKIGIIAGDQFDMRMSKALNALAQLPLFSGKLPNKVYDTRSLQMTNYTNELVDAGIGWSALDIARMTVPLNILLYDFPKHAGLARQILSNWDFAAMVEDGVLIGARIKIPAASGRGIHCAKT